MQPNKQFDPKLDKYLGLFCDQIKDIIKNLDESNQTDLSYFFDETSWDFVELSVQYASESYHPYVIFPIGFFSELGEHLTPEMTTRERSLVLECARAFRLAQELRFEKPDAFPWMTFRTDFEESRQKILELQASDPISVNEIIEKVIRRSICRNKHFDAQILASQFVTAEEFRDLQINWLGKVLFDGPSGRKRSTILKEISILVGKVKDSGAVRRGEVFEISRRQIPFAQ